MYNASYVSLGKFVNTIKEKYHLAFQTGCACRLFVLFCEIIIKSVIF